MEKDAFSYSLFALMAGATVGAGVGLLLAPQSGTQFRASLRELTRTAKDHVDGATDQGAAPDATGVVVSTGPSVIPVSSLRSRLESRAAS